VSGLRKSHLIFIIACAQVIGYFAHSSAKNTQLPNLKPDTCREKEPVLHSGHPLDIPVKPDHHQVCGTGKASRQGVATGISEV
jgi:hypothetical protein